MDRPKNAHFKDLSKSLPLIFLELYRTDGWMDFIERMDGSPIEILKRYYVQNQGSYNALV